jgi:hypothetical protein
MVTCFFFPYFAYLYKNFKYFCNTVQLLKKRKLFVFNSNYGHTVGTDDKIWQINWGVAKQFSKIKFIYCCGVVPALCPDP